MAVGKAGAEGASGADGATGGSGAAVIIGAGLILWWLTPAAKAPLRDEGLT
ncbi:hypothetical protein J4558_06450 [Leptolyngbya sp. 15MV]|nr:hypothetical protein J4558_06450 [Leptolyngbya sp. 15MV]